ncbi:MAG: hypothetical protein V8Q79_11430 [Christensenellales bacterium]
MIHQPFDIGHNAAKLPSRQMAMTEHQMTGSQGVVNMMKNGSVTAAPREPAYT